MDTYQNGTHTASVDCEDLPNAYLLWAQCACVNRARVNRARPELSAAVSALTEGMAVNVPEDAAKIGWHFKYIPEHRRREWLDKLTEITGYKFERLCDGQVPEYVLQEVILTAKPSDRPERYGWDYRPGGGHIDYGENYEQKWLERQDPETVKSFYEFIELTMRYLPNWRERSEDFDPEEWTRLCAPRRRVAFVIELARYSEQTIAEFLESVCIGLEHQLRLPRCLEELKTKSTAELDRIVRYASFNDTELDALMAPTDEADPRMLVSGLLPDRGLTIAYGDTDAGKTYFALEIAAAVAAGRPVFGHFAVNHPGVVVYFCGEDPGPFKKSRVAAVEQAYGPLDGKLIVLDRALPLDDDLTLDKFQAALWRLRDKLTAESRRIALVVSDTLGMMVNSLNDRDPRTAQKFTTITKGIVRDLDCAMLVTAHDTKSGDELAGTKVFLNNVPWTLHVRGQHDHTGLLTSVSVDQGSNDKKRVTAPIAPFRVRCKPITLPAPVNDHATDVILTDYAQIVRAKPAPKTANGDANDIESQIRVRLSAGDSRSKIARDLGIRKATVLKIAQDMAP